MRLARRDVERLKSGVKADVTFEEFSVLLVDISLAHVTGAQRPEEIDGKGRGCIGDSDSAFLGGGIELIGVRTGLKC